MHPLFHSFGQSSVCLFGRSFVELVFLWFSRAFTCCFRNHVALLQIADTITELKLGNGTSVLIFANIASALPTSVGAALSQAASKDSANVAIYAGAFFLTTLGIVYVQEAERKIPMNYASRYRNSALSRQSYLPFKVSGFSQTMLMH